MKYAISYRNRPQAQPETATWFDYLLLIWILAILAWSGGV